ncbi:MAG: radical SAM protein [Desulfobacterales bacterium]|nr:radical SAM protein [Desulfobacterales bacterium]
MKTYLTAVVANAKGEIVELEGYAAVGMSGNSLIPMYRNDTIPTPYGSEFMFLPDRKPIVYDIETCTFETLDTNPFLPNEPIYPVAVFNSPGYLVCHVCAYEEREQSKLLPLFSYGAVGFSNGSFRSSAICIDQENRQDLRFMPEDKIQKAAKLMQKKMGNNRLWDHLKKCALTYGCPAAKNFLLKRYEGPLPTSEQCNARCLGCLSLQTNSDISSSQERIRFTPSPKEISEIALEHIHHVQKSIVSFGQGCEGEPLLAHHVIMPAIQLIRRQTEKGTINMNTNASRPDLLEPLFDAGLDSIRVSMNSARMTCYQAYFRPKTYQFSDIENSIDLALKRKKYVSINLLNCSGVTDSPEEVSALMAFIEKHPIHRIQWRNLNFDPLRYYQIMNQSAAFGKPIGMRNLVQQLKKKFPHLSYGYFNPPKEQFENGRLKYGN